MTAPDAPLELLRLSTAIAESLEARDLDRAERLVEERARWLASASSAASPGARSPALESAQAAVLAADLRSHAALHAAITSLRRELGALATGAAALRAYDTPGSRAPGFVDRRD